MNFKYFKLWNQVLCFPFSYRLLFIMGSYRKLCTMISFSSKHLTYLLPLICYPKTISNGTNAKRNCYVNCTASHMRNNFQSVDKKKRKNENRKKSIFYSHAFTSKLKRTISHQITIAFMLKIWYERVLPKPLLG